MNNKFHKGLIHCYGKSHIFVTRINQISDSVKLHEVSFQKKFTMKMSSMTQHYL